MLRHRTRKEQRVVVVQAIVSTICVVSIKLKCTYLNNFVNERHSSKSKRHTETQKILDTMIYLI